MALGQFLDLVENRYSGVPMSNVTVKAFDVTTETQLNIYADVNGTPFDPANEAVSDEDGMVSFFLEEEAAKIRFDIAGQTIKTIAWYSNRGATGATGPANSTYALTADLEAADVANLSAILSEAGKAGTFTIRAYSDFIPQVAADTDKINYIRSTDDATKVWVRDSILTEGAERVGSSSGLSVQGDIDARPTSATLAASTGGEAIGLDDGVSGANYTTVAGYVDHLASEDGAGEVSVRITPTASVQSIEEYLQSLPANVGSYGTAATDGNVTDYTAFLSVQERNIDQPIDRNVAMPKLNMVSSYAAAKLFHGFPSAVRYDGDDYILYREGDGHTETTPFTTTSRLVCSVRDVNGVTPTSRTVIYAPSGIDPRDPNVLRDDSGGAILVSGKFKVVMFEYATNYGAGNASAKVWNLDPANLAAGLTSSVTIPAPIEAVKSDVRLLSTGVYAFIGYSTSSNCYLVTTSDWATFTTELIGPGNEAAFCETTFDATLNVVVRGEERFGNKCSVFYKRDVAGGAWRVHDVLPYTLNAPTFVLAQGIRGTVTAAPGATEGWLLLARDKTGRTALTFDSSPISELVCLRAKNDYGRTIDTFVDRTVIAGSPISNSVTMDGDANYCTAVAGAYSGQLEVYTYGEFKTSLDVIASTFRVGVYRISVFSDADRGVRPIMPQRRNLVRNSHFAQGAAGVDTTNANSAVVVDSITGRNVLRISDKITSNYPFVMADTLPGETLFPKITTKLNFSDLAGTGRHVVVQVRNGETDAVIQTDAINLNPSDFFGVARTVVCRPVVAPSTKIKLVIQTATDAGLTNAESDIFHIELSDDYSRDPIQGDPIPPTVKLSPQADAVLFGTTAGGASSTATYSSGFWSLFGDVKASGLPIEAADYTKLSVRLENCTTNAGAVLVRCTKCLVNSDGSISASFTTESGVLTASVSCRAIIEIAT